MIKILAPCGMLGYGYPMSSFNNGILQKPNAIVVDAGSTDGGPHKLGAGVGIVSREACKRDLVPMIDYGIKANIPVLIGSAGGSGARVHVEWTYDIIKEILLEKEYTSAKVAIIWTDISKEDVLFHLKNHQLLPLGDTVPPLTETRLQSTKGVVAQIGHEPIVKALEQGADIILCGRAYDPAPFAAVAEFHGYDRALGYHLGKILECAALCAIPGTTHDSMLGTLFEDSFLVTPLSNQRWCTPTSVAAHTFYEKSHPYLLQGPGYLLNLEDCIFQQEDAQSVRVSGSKIQKTDPYYIKLEGAMHTAYRTFVIAGIRDPLMIENLESIQKMVKQQVQEKYIPVDGYTIRFINYGINGVMGHLEPFQQRPHEVGVVLDVLAPTQEKADAICATLRSTLLHYGYEGRKSTAGNLAFPFAPSDISFGPVYEFSVYHLMPIDDPLKYFPIEIRGVCDGE